MNLISVIVPCWNEEETIPIYYEHMCPVMDAIDADCELIFVDDGSQDATLSEMKKLSEKDARCQYLSFREISEKKRPSTRDSVRQREIMWW